MIATRDRLRGFMYQYVIARAPTFSKDKETEEAWECTLRARTIFHAIDKVADAEPEDPHPLPQSQQAGAASASNSVGPGPLGRSPYYVPPDRSPYYTPPGVLREPPSAMSKAYQAAKDMLNVKTKK